MRAGEAFVLSSTAPHHNATMTLSLPINSPSIFLVSSPSLQQYLWWLTDVILPAVTDNLLLLNHGHVDPVPLTSKHGVNPWDWGRSAGVLDTALSTGRECPGSL